MDPDQNQRRTRCALLCPDDTQPPEDALWMLAARLLAPLASRLPGLLRVPVLKARMMPLRYPDKGLVAALGSLPQDRFDALMARAVQESRE